MRYCTKCVLPETHETIRFDKDGVCNICRQSEKKEAVDWDARKRMLLDLVNRYRDKGEYDCIIPFSGGKDSTYQLWYVVKELGLKPLVVRFNHWGYRPLVHENNIKTFTKLNVDVIEYTPKWDVVRKLMLQSLKSRGDFCWHCHTGVFAHSMQMAVKEQVPLVIWGESSSEYRAYYTAEEMEELDEKAFNQLINLGITADDMYDLLGGVVSKRDLLPFQFPRKEELQSLGAKSIWLGNYIPWDTKEQVRIIKEELGWRGQEVEGIPPQYDYEKIECRWQGIRDYCKFIKRGMGRTNHLACIDIRNGRLSRQEGWEMMQRYDGKRPASLNNFLELIGISEDEFIRILTENEVSHWGFERSTIEDGTPLPDMKQWDMLEPPRKRGEADERTGEVI